MALHRNAEHSSKRGGRVDARGLLIIARLARTLELERDPSELCRRGCGVDERWAMSDHSAATTSLLAVCCRLSATAGRTLYPRSGLGDSNSMRKPLCPPYTHTHTHEQTGGRTEVADTWNLVGCVDVWAISLTGHHQFTKELHGCPLFTQIRLQFSLLCTLSYVFQEMPR
jgi:hypothetical protein